MFLLIFKKKKIVSNLKMYFECPSTMSMLVNGLRCEMIIIENKILDKKKNKK